MIQEPFFIDGGNAQLYSVLFMPDKGFSNKVFLFCHPLFEEKNGLGQVFIEPSAKRPIPPFSATAKQSLNNSLTEEDRAYYISQYDGEIKFTDDQIGILFIQYFP